MLPSLILNSLLILCNAGCMVWGLKKSERPSALFRYFTTLSNLLCAAAAAAVIIMQLAGGLELWTVIFKYAGTCAVTVTMLTVLLFLGPVSHHWRDLVCGAELFLHVICPALAIISFMLFEKTDMPAWVIAIGAAPVLLYAALYGRKVLYSPPKRRWDDFYGFNKSGKWQLSFAAMLAGAALVALALWAIDIRIA